MSKKFLVSFDPGAGGDFFNHVISRHRGFYKSTTYPGNNNNVIYENPTNDLGLMIKQIPMVFDKINVFDMDPKTDVLSLSSPQRQYVNYIINESFKRNICLGTHWYDPNFSKFPLDDVVPIKFISSPEYMPVFFSLLFLKNWDHLGHDPINIKDLIETTLTPDQRERFLSLSKYRGWERFIIMWDVPVKSLRIEDAMIPLYNEFVKRCTVKNFSNEWHYVDIGDFWFNSRRDKEQLESIYDIKFDMSIIDKWSTDNQQMLIDKFGLTLEKFKDEKWIESVIKYFKVQYGE